MQHHVGPASRKFRTTSRPCCPPPPRAELQAAEAELAKLSPIDPLWREVDARRRWALARLDVAK